MNLRFSQRQGLTPKNKPLQIDDMDQQLTNGLWDVFKIHTIDSASRIIERSKPISEFNQLCALLWHNFFKWPIDKIPTESYKAVASIRTEFFDSAWYEVYDLLEYVATLDLPWLSIENFKDDCNRVLEREFAGYRFLDGLISPITNAHEVQEIQSALDNAKAFTGLRGCNIHLTAALAHLSNRTNPDYRNSIKESISAIESLAKKIAGDSRDTLGPALDKIKVKISLHPALEKGFKAIYGYTSDSSGIRHALTEAPNCDFEDAKYMLVSCSAFINYLIVKAKKAGIALECD